jgi:hypothetical protein
VFTGPLPSNTRYNIYKSENLKGRENTWWEDNIVRYLGVIIDGVLDWMIEFIDTLFTQLGTTGNTELLLTYTL